MAAIYPGVYTTSGQLTGGGVFKQDLTLGLATTGVSANTYGSASSMFIGTVDVYGRLTSASSTSIQITDTQVTNLSTKYLQVTGGSMTGTIDWITDDAYNIGDSTHRTATVFTENINSGNVTLTQTSAVANGSGATGFLFNTSNTLNNATSKLMVLQNNGTTQSYFDFVGDLVFTQANAGITSTNASSVLVVPTTTQLVIFGGDVTNNTDNFWSLGNASKRWAGVYASAFNGTEQTGTTTGAVTVTPSSGETYTIIATGNITGITISAGTAGQVLTLVLKQKSDGAPTWVTTMTNCLLVGGSFSKTTSANGVDTISFRYSPLLGKWVELHRSLNLS